MKGTIKRLIRDKFFGFITPEGGDQDVFFHSSVITGGSFEDLTEGQTVEFSFEDAPKGPKATEVSISR